MNAGFVIDGAKELEAKLRTLPRTLQRRAVRTAVRAGQRPLLQRARANARSLRNAGRAVATVGRKRVRAISMSELLARNIVIKAPRRQRPGSYSLHVQLRDQPAFHSGDAYIPAAIEYGHGANKEQAARPYFRPAAHATRQQALLIVGREMANALFREAIKARYR